MSRRIRSFICAVALALAPCAWAADVTLEEDLSPLVKALSRPVDVYHWTEAANARHATYTRRRMEEGALVTATDPVSTRRRGDEWTLLRYTLPKGFRFIDLRAADAQPLSSRAADRLRARACAAQSLTGLFSAGSGPACRKIAFDTVKLLQADAVVLGG